MGRISVPTDPKALAADVAAREAEEEAQADGYGPIVYQGAYVKELMDETDYPSFDVEVANQAFKEWKGHKKKNIMTFRDNGYVSPLSGKRAPAHHTPWKDALDDSMEAYLKS